MTSVTIQRAKETQSQAPTKRAPWLYSTVVWILACLALFDVGLTHFKPLKYVQIPGLIFHDADVIHENIERALGEAPYSNVFFLGSSLLNAIMTCDDALKSFAGIEEKTTSIGITGAMMSDQQRLLEELLKRCKKPKVVFLFVAPRDFSDNNVPILQESRIWKCLDSQQQTFNTKSFSTPRLVLERTLESTLEKVWRFFAVKGDYKLLAEIVVCSFFDRKPTLYSAVLQNHRKIDLTVQLPWSLASAPSAKNLKEYSEGMKAYYKRAYGEGTPGRLDKEFECLAEILYTCRKEGVTAIVVEMPLSGSFDELLPASLRSRYKTEVASSCKLYKAELVDMRSLAKFNDDDFSDGIHLNKNGSMKLWKGLALELLQRPRLRSVFTLPLGR